MENVQSITRIPLANLRPSALNARTIDGEPVHALAASIAAEGLLQNLTVTAADDGMFEVVAGERRRRALCMLRDRAELPSDLETVPCLLVHNGRAMSASLAENSVREKMHPADELAAFRRLVEEGRSIDDIAHEFGIEPLQVQRHLKLTKVAPELFELFRQGEISLEQMHALAVTNDREAQVRAWNTPNHWEREPSELRRKLTKGEINVAKDPAARLVGIEALIKSGATVRRDLFGKPDEGYTTDRATIDSLAMDQLEKAAEAVRAEGWSWVAAAIDVPFDERANYTQIYGERKDVPLSAADLKRRDALIAEMDELEEIDNQGGLEEDQSDRYDEIQQEIATIDAPKETWTAEQMAAAGAFVTIGAFGAIEILRGFVRKGGKVPGSSTQGGKGSTEKGKGKADTGDLSETLTRRLTAHRTSILQSAIAVQTPIALALLAHALMLPVFYPGRGDRALVTLRLEDPPKLEQLADELPTARHWNALREHIKVLQKGLPAVTELLSWLLDQPSQVVLDLLAVCAALAINTVTGHDTDKAQRAAIARVATVAGVDFTALWQPTRESFLGFVPRAVIEQAVLEGCDAKAVETLAPHQKQGVIDAAQELLAGTGWVPKPLRFTVPKAAPASAAAAAPVDQAKPVLKKAPAKGPAAKVAKPKPAAKPAAKAAAKPGAKTAKAPAKKAAKKAASKAKSKAGRAAA